MHNIDSYSIKIKIKKKKRWLLDLYVGNATWVTPYNKICSILILLKLLFVELGEVMAQIFESLV